MTFSCCLSLCAFSSLGKLPISLGLAAKNKQAPVLSLTFHQQTFVFVVNISQSTAEIVQLPRSLIPVFSCFLLLPDTLFIVSALQIHLQMNWVSVEECHNPIKILLPLLSLNIAGKKKQSRNIGRWYCIHKNDLWKQALHLGLAPGH